MIPWQVIGVMACGNEDHAECVHSLEIGAAPFVYTVGLEVLAGYELWVSTRGTCGHTVHWDGASVVLNQIGYHLVDGDLPLDRLVSVPFETATLEFQVGEPHEGRRELLQTFMAGDAPVAVVDWSCCGGKP